MKLKSPKTVVFWGFVTSRGESSNFLEDFSQILKINVPY
jgi:hypothetical protein